MTARLITPPYRSGARTRDGGFSRLLSAEWTKFRTVRGWVIGMLTAALATVLIGLLTGASGYGSCNRGGCPATLGPGGEPVSDSFYFVRQPLASSGSITVRVTSLSGLIPDFAGRGANPGTVPGLAPWSKAGVIIKASTRPGSAYAAMMVTGSHGVRMQYDYAGDIAGPPGTVSPPSAASPRWLRLTRAGDTITGYESADGTGWARVGIVRLAGLPATVQAGLFATSPQYTQLAGASANGGPTQDTAVFDHVSLRGAGPGGAWAGDQVGGPPALGQSGFHQAGGQVSITGAGDIAPDVAGAAGPGTTIAQPLLGTFAGLIAVIVVATMFVTAEYRRGLIRTTLTASPRRGQVLAAKAVVIGAVTFVPGLAAAAIAVWVGDRILRNNGVYVFPVTALTGLRVVAGTAAVLALVGVLALGLGAALRRSVVAVTTAIAVVVLPYLIVLYNVLPIGASQWLLRIAPAAGFAVQGTMPQYPQVSNLYDAVDGYYPLAPWAGLAVLCAWAALALGLAVVLLRRRDA